MQGMQFLDLKVIMISLVYDNINIRVKLLLKNLNDYISDSKLIETIMQQLRNLKIS